MSSDSGILPSGSPGEIRPGPDRSAAFLSARGLSKRFGGVAALAGADFDGSAGEVHALIGENGAGKSTLVKTLTGIVTPDAGEILLGGEPMALSSPRHAQAAGVASVSQEISLIPDLSVGANIFLGREERNVLRMVSERRVRLQARDFLAEIGLPAIDPARAVASLSLAEQQLVELARALQQSPRVLILDEATSALSPNDVDALVRLARESAARGCLVIFVSHRLREVRRIADRITVFRNGRRVSVHESKDVDDDTLLLEMLGRRPGRLFAQATSQPGERLRMVVRGLAVPGRLAQVDLNLREGEILGIGGLQGQGQGELLLALYGGLQSRGQFLVDGKEIKLSSPRDALAAGVALVPEDRKREGLLLSKSIRQNVSLATLHRFTRLGLLQLSREDSAVRRITADLQVQSSDLDQLAGELSGGNQQKLVLAKALLTEARVLLLYDPTRGVDVGTKAQIFQLMRDLAGEGYSFVFYSTDLQELVEMSDRIAVMSEGRIVAELDGDDMTEEQILRAAMGTAG